MKIKSLADMVTYYIEELIIKNELKMGEQIKEGDMADRFDVSRPPIREAFKTLEAEGLVIKKPRKGVFVVKMNKKDLWEVYTLKAVLYESALDFAMQNITDKQIDHLQFIIDKMEACAYADPPDIFNYQKWHGSFHLEIMEIAGNQRLTKIALTLHKQISRFSYKTLHNMQHLVKSFEYHKKIIKMIAEKKRGRACKIMKEHVLDAMNFLLEWCETNVP